MGKLSNETKEKIQLIKSDEIRVLLLDALNKHAKTLNDLFCSKSDEQPIKKSVLFNASSPEKVSSLVNKEDILTLVFAYAPEALCIKLTHILINLDVKKAVTLLKPKNYGSVSALIAVFTESPDGVQMKISDWLVLLSYTQIQRIFGSNFLNYRGNEEATIKLLKGLHYLKSETILNFFTNDGYRTRPYFFGEDIKATRGLLSCSTAIQFLLRLLFNY